MLGKNLISNYGESALEFCSNLLVTRKGLKKQRASLELIHPSINFTEKKITQRQGQNSTPRIVLSESKWLLCLGMDGWTDGRMNE